MDDQTARLEEYKTLRDETLRRIDARNQILSYTLAFAAAMFTLGLGKDGFSSVLLVYPIVAFFFATSFSYSSLMLIQIGQYLRGLERDIPGLRWATTLGPRYRSVEIFELISTAGLFLGTQLIGILFYHGMPVEKQNAPAVLYWVAVTAVFFTVVSCLYPWFHHRTVMETA